MSLLFDIPPTKYAGKQCRHCIHMCKNQWNSKLKYCSKKRGTGMWAKEMKRIKAKDPACPMFEEINKPDQ